MFDWEDFLALAEELAARPEDEAASRSAISRAYYATFHVGREYLIRSGIPLNRGRFAHLQVQQELQKLNDKIAEDVGRLHTWRKEADYDNPCSFNVIRIAPFAVATARTTIAMIRALA